MMLNTATLRFQLAAFVAALLPAHLCVGFPPDNTPPAAVTTLAVPVTSYASISFAWMAVGDDGGGAGQCSGAGKAFSYDFRYSTSAPGGDPNAWFAAATQAAGEPAPKACGSAESFCISGLTPGTTYFAALKVNDDANNVSGVSNIVSAAAGSDMGVMHVASVQSSWFHAGGVKKRGQAFVTVVDALGGPVPCAMVTVQWTGCFNDTASGVSDHTGLARVVSNRTANCWNFQCCFFVTVTDVSHAGFTYDASANIESTSGVGCNLFEPPGCPAGAAASPCPDRDGDGTVGALDLLDLVAALGSSDCFPGGTCPDLDGDLSVGIADLLDLLAAWGPSDCRAGLQPVGQRDRGLWPGEHPATFFDHGRPVGWR